MPGEPGESEQEQEGCIGNGGIWEVVLTREFCDGIESHTQSYSCNRNDT
jgi:hypothetical protein